MTKGAPGKTPPDLLLKELERIRGNKPPMFTVQKLDSDDYKLHLERAPAGYELCWELEEDGRHFSATYKRKLFPRRIKDALDNH